MTSDNHKENSRQGIHVHPLYIVFLVSVNLIVLMVLGWPRVRERIPRFHTETATASPTLAPTLTSTPTPTVTPSPTAAATAPPAPQASPTAAPSPTPATYNFAPTSGTLILSLREGGDTHLFAYRPFAEPSGETFTALPLTRLTSGRQNDITPAFSPDGKSLAFASNRGGAWDIYILTLEDGKIRQFTDTAAYEAHPTWSPDGLWLAFEAYEGNNLEVMLQDMAQENAPINLSNHPGADYAPAWSSEGRQISFVSTRGGRAAVWVADLDEQEAEKRFSQVSAETAQGAGHPAWSAGGRYLAWGEVTADGVHQVYIWDSAHPGLAPSPSGSGDWPAWGGDLLFATLDTPLETFLTAYPLGDAAAGDAAAGDAGAGDAAAGDAGAVGVMLPAVRLPGAVEGLAWGEDIHLDTLGDAAAASRPAPLWEAKLSFAQTTGGRYNLVTIKNLDAPYPQLHDLVDESFSALRDAAAQKLGWDFLATLEDAYIPLTAPPDPGQAMSWTFTGRGLAISDLPRQAGWMVVVREDYGAQTYWRVYVRANSQDGGQGRPLHELPWDFEARYGDSSLEFEGGGAVAQAIPSGYWVDFTTLAAEYGWERLPALSRWRTAFPLARFQEFAMREGLTWQEAMLEIYPPEAIYTPTPGP